MSNLYFIRFFTFLVHFQSVPTFLSTFCTIQRGQRVKVTKLFALMSSEGDGRKENGAREKDTVSITSAPLSIKSKVKLNRPIKRSVILSA